jgi:hypothetical protein
MPRDAAAKPCLLCARRTVGAYDVQLFPEPTDAARTVDWMNLYLIGGFVEAALFGGDDCTRHIDGALENAATIGNGTLRSGAAAPNVPPDGPIPDLDYLFTGNVQDTGGGYSATILLETAISREIVTSATFSLAYNFSPADVQTQANAAAAAIGPLGATLGNYEQTKRDTDNTVAIGEDAAGSNGLSVITQAGDLKPGESTEVDLQLLDCDGKPLAGREIILEAFNDPDLGPFPGPTGGTVSPSRVYTDDNGNAKATFTAGSTPGPATIPAAVIYFRPPGNKFAFIDHTVVNLTPDVVWRVEADFLSEDTINQNWVVTGPHDYEITETFEQQTSESSYHVDFTCTGNNMNCGFDLTMADYFGTAAGFSASNYDPSNFTGYTRYSRYQKFYATDMENIMQPPWLKPTEHLSLQSWTFNGSGVFASGSGDSPQLSLSMGTLIFGASSQGTETLINSTFDTDQGWQDGPSWSNKSSRGNGMSCSQDDTGAQWVLDPKGGIGITCTQSEDHNRPDDQYTEHIETKIFFKMTPLPAAGR